MKIKVQSDRLVRGDQRVNVQKAGEVYRWTVCGNVVLVTEAGVERFSAMESRCN